MGKSFRTLAGFGKRVEYWIFGQMLREGLRSIWFNGLKKDKSTSKKVEYCKSKFNKYIAKDFSKLK